MIVSHRYTVGIQDMGANYELTNRALIEALSNTANIHGIRAGHGVTERSRHHLSWVISGWKLEVLRRPRTGEDYTVQTWSGSYEKVIANRDYQVFSSSGELLARAASRWMCLDTERGRLLRLTPEIMDPYQPETERAALPEAVWTDPRDLDIPAQRTLPFRALRCMIDCNQHVHNTAYLDMAREVLPEEVDQRHFDHLEVLYKREVKPGDTVRLEYAFLQDRHYVLIRDESDVTLHAAVIMN
ncbi:MAG: hypothetical protein II888_02710 [Clostridia bacterium]|nr:hypothetical protein [Clostridia bacterium]